MAKTIITPEFRYTGLYYPQILDLLVQLKRANVPELTDESEFEPSIQILRAFAAASHLSNTLADVVANESTLATARLVQTIRNMLKLIGERLEPAAPSQADLVLQLISPLGSLTEIAPAGAQVATKRTNDSAAVVFETGDAATAVGPTDVVGFVFIDVGGVFTDRTTQARTATPFAAFAGSLVPGTAIYVGLLDAMWDQLDLTVTVPMTGIDGVWEFFDGNLDLGNPDDVVNLGPNLRFDLNGLLGIDNRAGAVVRVRLSAESGAFEDCVSQWDGTTNFITTTALLGQTTPSTDIIDYSVGNAWRELDIDSDGTNNIAQTGAIKYGLPQDLDRNWSQATVNSEVAFWLRFRIVDVLAPAEPHVSTVAVTGRKQYAIVEVTQGQTQSETLGSSDGSPRQTFTASQKGFIDGTMNLSVDGIAWTIVDNFLNSSASDQHFTVDQGDNDVAVVNFGDGVNGVIPAVGANNIVATYRFGAQTDGNVGAGTITVDRSGLSLINSVSNPRAATGWQESEATDDASLARAKIRAPASLRVRNVAVGPQDVERMALDYVDATGARPFSRAFAIEEGFGPKTIEVVLVSAGGGQPSSDQLTAFETFMNGDRFARPPLPKRVVANQQVFARAYAPRIIDVQASLKGNFVQQEIVDAFVALLQPEAFEDDGTTYVWDFGGRVPLSRINAEFFANDSGVTEVVTLLQPVASIDLGARELPTLGTIIITKV